ncbi:DUF3426 domain-containing protein [Massilia phyllosphaerae]|uniref:DUF3426 domain-containing protein n=1 Tax=Massilia phyllosphaerae TaxID=3106034 RepID=UPI002B1CC3BA|nr:DUF3426 domain-containing protein [Massilia sp. SGZ-792]
MALATQCPFCQTRFRVASDQLKLRGGIVRCGACQRIFDGSAHLIDLDAPKPAPGPEMPPPTSGAEVAAPSPAAAPQEERDSSADFMAQPVQTLDFTNTFAPPGILPEAAPDAAAAPVVQDPEPPHGDVLAHAVEEVGAGPVVDIDLTPPSVEAPEPEAAEPQPQDPEPPHGDVLAHALEEAGAGPVVDVDLPPPDDEAPEPEAAESQPQPQPQDPEPPHGDVLAHAVEEAGTEPLPPPPQDPEPPHGDVLAHAVETLTFAPQGRIEPRIEPWAEPRREPRLAPEDNAPAAAPPEPVAPTTIDTPAAPAASAASVAPPSFAPPGRIEPSFDLPVDEELVAQPLPGDEQAFPTNAGPHGAPQHAAAVPDESAPPLPLRASAGADPHEPSPATAAAPRSARAKALDARARRTKLTPTRIEAPRLRVPESDEPEFVKRSRKQEHSSRTRRIAMAIGAVVLLLVLAAQLVLNFRNVLAARYPGARPALGAACALLGCRIELPTQIDNLAIENGELTTLGPDTYSLNTLLRNQGNLVQAWPSIELELTDANDKAVLRRVFAPGEYLPQNGAAAPGGFGPRSEQPIKLHFALADLKPSSYHIFIFYP